MSYHAMRYSEKWELIAKAWDDMKINKGREAEFEGIARRLIAHKNRYLAVEARTGVPWYMIAVLHMREASGDFTKYLGNGEPLNRVTKLVPRGRGPFKTWEDGAVDALKLQRFDDIKDWRLEKIIFQSVLYNGLGYEMRKLPSPYIWGGTNIQKPGKFVADGKFDSKVMDKQPGVAPIMWTMAEQDPDIHFVRET